jgi:hypothetical protein
MATDTKSSLQTRLEAATRKYQDLQEELSKHVEARERLGAQQVETESVKKVTHTQASGLKSQTLTGQTGVCHTQTRKRRLQAYWTRAGSTGTSRGKIERG